MWAGCRCSPVNEGPEPARPGAGPPRTRMTSDADADASLHYGLCLCQILLLHPVAGMLDSSPGQTGGRMGEELNGDNEPTDGRTDAPTVEMCDPPDIVMFSVSDPSVDLFC